MASDTLRLENNICPICLYVFIQPVTMPCGHELCLTCFKQNVEEANFCCPMCRTRISTWARRASRNKKLVNQARWEEIQRHFQSQVQNRLAGLEEEDEEMQALNVSIRLAEPGEIRNEYEEQLKKLQAQRCEERRREQEASERLIQELQAEEDKKLQELKEIQQQDEQFAKALSEADPGADSPFVQRTRSASSTTSGHSAESASIAQGEVKMEVEDEDSDTFSGGGASSHMEAFLEKMRREQNPSRAKSRSKSPYPYTCLSPLPSGAGKLCVDKDRTRVLEERFMRQKDRTRVLEERFMRQKVKKDRNLITTQDIASLEEQFKLNVAKATATATPDNAETDCLKKALGTSTSLMATMTKVVSSSNLVDQTHVLGQMSEELDASVKTVDNDDDSRLRSAIDDEDHEVIVISTPTPEPPSSATAEEGGSGAGVEIDQEAYQTEEAMSDESGRAEPERSSSAQSTDSISVELSHFRPIRSCPLTPPRVLPGGKVVEPQLIRTTPRNLSKSGLGSPSLSDIDGGSPIMQRRLSELAEERKDQVVRLSKSTSTGSSTVDDDENRNPDEASLSKLARPALRSNSANRGDEFKDISNSPFQKRKFEFGAGDCEPPPAKRKPILALEPDLDDGEIVMPDPLDMVRVVPDKDENVLKLDGTTSIKRNRLSRNRHTKSGRVRYTVDETCASPQPSIAQWVKTGEQLKLCVGPNGLKDSFIENSRDEVDGGVMKNKNSTSTRTKTLKNKKSDGQVCSSFPSLHQDGHQDGAKTKSLSTLDKFLVQSSEAVQNSKLHRPRRQRKSAKQTDYVYAKCVRGDSRSRNYTEHDSDLESEDRSPSKRSRRSVGTESDSSFDPFESEEVLSNKSDGSFADFSPKRLRKDLFLLHSPPKRNKTNSGSAIKFASVKHKKVNKDVGKRKSVCNSVNKDSTKGKCRKSCPRTIDSFLQHGSVEERTRAAKDEAACMDLVVDQEERDRLMALELQKQFELEAKLNISAFRFKGTKDEYSLRKTRKSKVVMDS